jgi:glycosyltransferase involved in cell wall biosynthesis
MAEKVLGIGIITYNRRQVLEECIARILKHTKLPYRLLVADDGSPDDTAEVCRKRHIDVITGENRGVCWNKNRALYTLMNYDACDPILLLEEDCWPIVDGWEKHWIEAAARWHHVGFAHPAWPANWCCGGTGTPADPWLTAEMTGQATVSGRFDILTVGYLDTRFKGYGFGHIEWTERFCKAGYMKKNRIPCMTGGLELQVVASYRNTKDIKRNLALINEIRRQPFVYVDPWQDEEEKALLEHEVRTSFGLPY